MKVNALRFTLTLLGIALLVADVSAQRPGQSPQRGGGLRLPDRLKEGDAAPDFTLKSPNGQTTVTLSDYHGQKPVALIFGSYT